MELDNEEFSEAKWILNRYADIRTVKNPGKLECAMGQLKNYNDANSLTSYLELGHKKH